jgi:hypothetical protein
VLEVVGASGRGPVHASLGRGRGLGAPDPASASRGRGRGRGFAARASASRGRGRGASGRGPVHASRGRGRGVAAPATASRGRGRGRGFGAPAPAAAPPTLLEIIRKNIKILTKEINSLNPSVDIQQNNINHKKYDLLQLRDEEIKAFKNTNSAIISLFNDTFSEIFRGDNIYLSYIKELIDKYINTILQSKDNIQNITTLIQELFDEPIQANNLIIETRWGQEIEANSKQTFNKLTGRVLEFIIYDDNSNNYPYIHYNNNNNNTDRYEDINLFNNNNKILNYIGNSNNTDRYVDMNIIYNSNNIIKRPLIMGHITFHPLWDFIKSEPLTAQSLDKQHNLHIVMEYIGNPNKPQQKTFINEYNNTINTRDLKSKRVSIKDRWGLSKTIKIDIDKEIHDEITLVLTPSTTTINDNVSNKKRIFKELGDILVNPIIVALNDYCKYKTSLF